jgi:hypothetical protein
VAYADGTQCHDYGVLASFWSFVSGGNLIRAIWIAVGLLVVLAAGLGKVWSRVAQRFRDPD